MSRNLGCAGTWGFSADTYATVIKPRDLVYVDHTLRTRANQFLSEVFHLKYPKLGVDERDLVQAFPVSKPQSAKLNDAHSTTFVWTDITK